MRHQVHFPGQRAFEEQQAADWQCQTQLQVVTTEPDAKAKAMIEFQNAMFAAAYCRREDGRCEGCGS